MAKALRDRLQCPLVYAGISRLVIDCNRALEAPDLIPEVSAGIPIPGNARLSESARQRRIDEIHHPFHATIEEIIEARCKASQPTALITVHSFTPTLGGRERPWHVGLIQDRDRRLLAPVEAALSGEASLIVGCNVPYARGDGVLYTISRHGEARGIASLMVEIRNDLLASEHACERWGERLADALAPALGKLGAGAAS